MIKNWLITGDTHGHVEERLTSIDTNKYEPAQTALIILGDAGINFYLNKTDKNHKRGFENSGYTFYLVRGNHEERPENLESIEEIYDNEVQGTVWYQPDFPHIKYFQDGGEYVIDGHSALVIGGAYSVDKWYRIAGKDVNKWTGWFKDEQLTQEEMDKILNNVKGKKYDFVLTHTCPISWEPTDLFLAFLDQSTVDKSMELWFDEVKKNIEYGVWCFGHYHADQMVRPKVEMYFRDIEELNIIWNRWYDKCTIEQEWWLTKSPHYYYEDN